MRLSKLFKVIGLVTILALVYIHMQMKIIQLAYEGHYKEIKMRKLSEANSNLNYWILKLKSSRNLGDKLLNGESDIGFVDSQRIMKITQRVKKVAGRSQGQDLRKSKSLISMLSWDTASGNNPRR